MSLRSILESFSSEMDAHIKSVDALVAQKLKGADDEIHSKWEAMGEELKALQAKIDAAKAELASLGDEIALAVGLKQAQATVETKTGEAAKAE